MCASNHKNLRRTEWQRLKNKQHLSRLFGNQLSRGYPTSQRCRKIVELASQSILSWNQIIVWLREIETLRKAAAQSVEMDYGR
jgi:hypothetical protein